MRPLDIEYSGTRALQWAREPAEARLNLPITAEMALIAVETEMRDLDDEDEDEDNDGEAVHMFVVICVGDGPYHVHSDHSTVWSHALRASRARRCCNLLGAMSESDVLQWRRLKCDLPNKQAHSTLVH